MNDQLISVIVAVYNVEKYLNKCIESIVNQSYHNLEIILVDDGSEDRSGEICNEWAKKDSRIHVLRKKNGGLSDARNCGIKVASGRWLCFVDGDDYISLSMYEKLYKNRLKNGITVCGYYVIENGEKDAINGIEKLLTSKEAVDLYLKNEKESIANSSFTYFGSYAWNKLYDREVFRGLKYPTRKKFEDMYIMLELLHQSMSIRFVPDCEYYYVQRRTSLTHQKSIQVDSLEARLKQKRELEKFWNIKDTRINELIALEYISILKMYAIIPYHERSKYTSLRMAAWNNLKKLKCTCFPLKTKCKLLLCWYVPDIYHFLYWVNEKRKFKDYN